jgi:hypothetical protein
MLRSARRHRAGDGLSQLARRQSGGLPGEGVAATLSDRPGCAPSVLRSNYPIALIDREDGRVDDRTPLEHVDEHVVAVEINGSTAGLRSGRLQLPARRPAQSSQQSDRRESKNMFDTRSPGRATPCRSMSETR